MLSNTLTSALWPHTRFVRGLEDVLTLKRQPGRSIYLVGGASTVASLMDARLVDELRLIVHPLLAGAGKTLFATSRTRRKLALRDVRPTPDGRIHMTYAVV